jgi:hypothetical protein
MNSCRYLEGMLQTWTSLSVLSQYSYQVQKRTLFQSILLLEHNERILN